MLPFLITTPPSVKRFSLFASRPPFHRGNWCLCIPQGFNPLFPSYSEQSLYPDPPPPLPPPKKMVFGTTVVFLPQDPPRTSACPDFILIWMHPPSSFMVDFHGSFSSQAFCQILLILSWVSAPLAFLTLRSHSALLFLTMSWALQMSHNFPLLL